MEKLNFAVRAIRGHRVMNPSHPQIERSRFMTWGRYLNLANLMSAVRLPLAVAFGMNLDRPVIALVLLVAAGLSDLLDGMIARLTHQASRVGAIVDPIFDKLFVVIAIASLLVAGLVTPIQLSLILTRDLLMVPMLLALPLMSRQTRECLTLRSNVYGKITTVAQFSALIASLLFPSLLPPLTYLSAALGVLCALAYLLRALDEIKAMNASTPHHP